MRAVDTNVIIRFLTGDDPVQASRARSVIGQEAVFVARTVLLEAEWVLRSAYGLPKGEVIAALRALAGLPGLAIEDAALVAQAMEWAEGGMDFADALHLAACGGVCTALLTFDRQFAQAGTRRGGAAVVVL
jgi:predicted nucleic-acid-binding protein